MKKACAVEIGQLLSDGFDDLQLVLLLLALCSDDMEVVSAEARSYLRCICGNVPWDDVIVCLLEKTQLDRIDRRALMTLCERSEVYEEGDTLLSILRRWELLDRKICSVMMSYGAERVVQCFTEWVEAIPHSLCDVDIKREDAVALYNFRTCIDELGEHAIVRVKLPLDSLERVLRLPNDDLLIEQPYVLQLVLSNITNLLHCVAKLLTIGSFDGDKSSAPDWKRRLLWTCMCFIPDHPLSSSELSTQCGIILNRLDHEAQLAIGKHQQFVIEHLRSHIITQLEHKERSSVERDKWRHNVWAKHVLHWWILQHVESIQPTESIVDALVPMVFKLADDHIMLNKRLGLEMLSRIVCNPSLSEIMRRYDQIMVNIAQRSSKFREEDVLPTTLRCYLDVLALVVRNEDVYQSDWYSGAIDDFLRIGEYSSDTAPLRIMLEHLSELLGLMKLSMLKYFKRLLKLLIMPSELHRDENIYIARVKCLGVMARHCWPRMQYHSPDIVRSLVQYPKYLHHSKHLCIMLAACQWNAFEDFRLTISKDDTLPEEARELIHSFMEDVLSKRNR